MIHRSHTVVAVAAVIVAAGLLFTACSSNEKHEFLNDMRGITQFERPPLLRDALEEVWKYQFLFWRPDDRVVQGRTLGGTKKNLGYLPEETVVMGYDRNDKGEIVIALADRDLIPAPMGGTVISSYKNARLQLIRPEGESSLEFEVAGTPIRGIEWWGETKARYSTDGGVFEIDTQTGIKKVLLRDKVQSHRFTGRSGEECWYIARDTLFVVSEIGQPPEHAVGAPGSTGFLPGPRYRSALTWNEKGELTCRYIDGSPPRNVQGKIEGEITRYGHTAGSSGTVIVSYKELTDLATDSFGGAVEGENAGLDHYVYHLDWNSLSATPYAAFRDLLGEDDMRPVRKVILIGGDGGTIYLWAKDKEKGYVPYSLIID